MMNGSLPGADMVNGSGPALPAAATTTMPASHNAFYLITMGTWLSIQRKVLAELMIMAGNKEYGGDTSTKIFLDDITTLIFPLKSVRTRAGENAGIISSLPNRQ